MDANEERNLTADNADDADNGKEVSTLFYEKLGDFASWRESIFPSVNPQPYPALSAKSALSAVNSVSFPLWIRVLRG
jgi:hypothetical protein